MSQKVRGLALSLGFVLLTPPALAGNSIIGLPEQTLIQCAGMPKSALQTGGATFYEFWYRLNSRGIPTCDATVGVKNGVVTSVTFKKTAFLLGVMDCDRLFAACH
jgi:hypothetical protein